jgi:3D (Asp-Asp-Asp) domain-containing protein/uncharacterized protein YabE (DUF348 family)
VPIAPARIRRTYYALAALALAAVVVALITGFVWARRTITIVVDGRASVCRTQAADVASALTEEHVAIADGDLVNPAPTAQLDDGATIVVRHAVPVTLALGSERTALKVVGSTVGDVLVAAGFDPGSGMKVTPGISSPLVPGMTIGVTDVFVRFVQQELSIPSRSRTVVDPTMPINTKRVVAAGAPGRLLRILETLVTGGKQGHLVLKAQQVVQLPVDTVVAVGSRRDFRVASAGVTRSVAISMKPPAEGKPIDVVATAYHPGEGGMNAATGARLGYGIIAVDPDVIPLGTRMFVPGYGYGVAADTGGAIQGNRIDVCLESPAAVDAWGVRPLTVILLP